ncbi:SMI1/KNR4 family protein [Streptomyces drozdowiczii]|uniref:SMI1/KNR4 family protein n=1 Tax=Streptomyces drozdowiczii TaxID=202862 RepID=A0ABY6PTS9_9ACTN|nr:SMI1/KNR4 family protein [Streptomyces drozdowiczii]MCX0245132.1 SMI1/KNR4 family protein [Streptomyces drozdowiczii]UZK55186.1 SMI1/KNR4 family protein [Streptomyces drozdowiczii]
MVDQQWSGVRQRVVALRAQPSSGKVFGSLGHRWVLEDPLTDDGLAELEAQIGVRLPDGYRSFLTRVGAGGAGPAYGLFPVRRVRGRWRWEGDGAELADLAMLARPFPEHGPDPEDLDALLAVRPEEEDFEEIEDFDDAIEAWDERWEALMYAPERTAGAIVISHLGCAQREWLVISGPHRGSIWSDCRADDADLVPLLDQDGKPVTFARWYNDWLREAELTAHQPATNA